MPPEAFILDNAQVITVDSDFRLFDGGAVAVQGSRIAAVGSSQQVKAQFPDWPCQNLGGKALLPGLVNCHTHLPMSLFRGIADDKELMEWLNDYIFPAEARALNPEFVRWGTRLSLWEMLRGGITTVVDMYMFEREVAEECARLGMRGVLGQAMIDFPTPDYASWEARVEGTRQFISDFRNHPRIIPAVAPHAPYTVSPEHLQECHRLAEELNCPLVIHLAETRGETDQIRQRYGATPVRHLERLGLLSRRLIAAHVVWPEDDEIPLLAAHQVGVGHCPQSNAKLACGIAPVVTMLEAGVAVGLGTDGCASNNDLDMWQEMRTANFLQKLRYQSPTVMSARQSLELITIGGARAAHLDDQIGSIEVGKKADLIVVNLDGCHQIPMYDPVSHLCYATKSSDVVQVFIDGQVVMQDGLVQNLDEAELRLAVAEQAQRVKEILRRPNS